MPVLSGTVHCACLFIRLLGPTVCGLLLGP